MIPRPRVTTISGGKPVSQAIEVMATGHSRLPVLGEDVDDVLGVICLRDVLALEPDTYGQSVREVARPAVMVPASVPLPGVLAQLREADEEFACVVDEYGGLAGVITLEDIAEELIGEITDEHDPGRRGPAHPWRRRLDRVRGHAHRRGGTAGPDRVTWSRSSCPVHRVRRSASRDTD